MIPSLAVFLVTVYLILRVKTVDWAAQNRFFISPAFGRIKARVRAGRIVQYVANLKGLGVHIDEETGKIGDGERVVWSFWWWIFGVRFIGLDSVHEYDIEVTEVSKDGQVTTKTVRAHSLHYSGSYPMVVTKAESFEGAKIGLRFRLTLRTIHAGECLKFKSNWISVARSAVKSATRDFVGKHKVRQLLAMQNELHLEDEGGFVELIKSLNTSEVGNPGLIETLGQEIISVNLESVDIEDESVAKSLIEQEVAIEHGKGEIALARKEAEKTVIEANAALAKSLKEIQAEKARGLAKNDVLRDQAEALGGPDGLVAIRKWEAIGGLKELKGTLVLGGKDTSIIVPTSRQEGEKI